MISGRSTVRLILVDLGVAFGEGLARARYVWFWRGDVARRGWWLGAGDAGRVSQGGG
jgi:hypothetical protein